MKFSKESEEKNWNFKSNFASKSATFFEKEKMTENSPLSKFLDQFVVENSADTKTFEKLIMERTDPKKWPVIAGDWGEILAKFHIESQLKNFGSKFDQMWK